MTRLTTSTQKTPITTTLSTRKPNRPIDQSKETTTQIPIQTTPQSTNARNATRKSTQKPSATTKAPDKLYETTTHQNQMGGKDPRFGDNDITEMPGDGKTTTTTADDLTTDSTTDEPSGDHSTKRPSRFDTTLEYDFNSSLPTTTESMDQFTRMATKRPGIETTTNQILTDVTNNNAIETTTTPIGMSQTHNRTIGNDCGSKRDCAVDEICFRKQCKKVCDTNGNVTKHSDACIEGTCENNSFNLIHEFTLFIPYLPHFFSKTHDQTKHHPYFLQLSTVFYSLNSAITACSLSRKRFLALLLLLTSNFNRLNNLIITMIIY